MYSSRVEVKKKDQIGMHVGQRAISVLANTLTIITSYRMQLRLSLTF